MIRMDCCPTGLVAENSILIADECTSNRFDVGRLLSGREEAKFHSSSVATPFEDGAASRNDGPAERSSNEEEVLGGLTAGARLNGEEDLEPGATSAAKGSAAT